MEISHGNGKTEYGPGVLIKLTGSEVVDAIHAYLVARRVHINGPRTVTVNGKLCEEDEVYVDPSGFVVNKGNKLSGRGINDELKTETTRTKEVNKNHESEPEVTSEKIGNDWEISYNGETIKFDMSGERFDPICSGHSLGSLPKPIRAEAERIFKQEKERKVLVERLKKYNRVEKIIKGRNSLGEAESINEIEAKIIWHGVYSDGFFSYLIELLDSVKNQEKVSEYLCDNFDNEFLQLFDAIDMGDGYCPHKNRVQADIERLVNHQNIPELEVICDLILAIESEGK